MIFLKIESAVPAATPADFPDSINFIPPTLMPEDKLVKTQINNTGKQIQAVFH